MKKMKIIIVEDDTTLRELYTELLSSEGYELDSAKDGVEGLEKIKNGGWDLILLDIMLPKMDGFEVANIMKQTTPKYPNGHIVFLTNLSGEEMQEKGYELGCKEYWTKSEMTPGQVVQKIKGILAELPVPSE